MFFDRVAAKQQAKQTIRIRRPSPMLVTLVFILLTTGVSSLVNLFASNPFVEAMMYIRQGYDPIDVYAVVFGTSTSALLIFISILMGLYSAIMSFGYQGYLLRLSRGGEAGCGSLIEGFNLAVKVVLLDLAITLFIFLWSLLFIIPGLVATYRYSQAVFCLLDDPDISVMEAIRRSKALMKGEKFNLFMVQLSFFGWYLLVSLLASAVGMALGYPYTTGGALAINLVSSIFGLWLNPYTGIVYADFYNNLIGWTGEPKREEGGYQGPELEF